MSDNHLRTVSYKHNKNGWLKQTSVMVGYGVENCDFNKFSEFQIVMIKSSMSKNWN